MDFTELQQVIAELEGDEVGNPGKKFIIPEKRVLVASDAHVPYMDYRLWRQMLQDIQLYKIECVLWLGDYMDLEQFSHYGVSNHKLDYQQVKKHARRVIEITQQYLGPDGYQVISMGNHDKRWILRLGEYENLKGLYQSVGLTQMMEEEQLYISENPTIEGIELLNAHGRLETQWTFQHPFKYRAPFANPNVVAKQTHKNAMCAHSHHLGLAPDETGMYWTAESGGMYDPNKIPYVFSAPQNMRPMMPGYFVILGDEQPIMKAGAKLGPQAFAERKPNTSYIRER